MTCDRYKNKLSAYVDRELSDEQMTAVALHVNACTDCREEVEFLNRLAATLRMDSIPAIPNTLSERIVTLGRQQLTDKQIHPHRWSLPHIYIWESLPGSMRAAAAVVLMVGLSAGTWLGLSVSSEEPPQPVQLAALESDPTPIYELDYFSDTPTGTLSHVYMTLSTPEDEGGK